MSGSTTDNTWSVPSCVLLWSATSPKETPSSFVQLKVTMPHTLLVSFSLLALVVTARPIVPISYVLNYDLCLLFIHMSLSKANIPNPWKFRTLSKPFLRSAQSPLSYCFSPSLPCSSNNLGNPTSTFSALRKMELMFV